MGDLRSGRTLARELNYAAGVGRAPPTGAGWMTEDSARLTRERSLTRASCAPGVTRSNAALHGSPASISASGRARRLSIAIVASARELACLLWCLLTRGEGYAFAQPSLTTKKTPVRHPRPPATTRPMAGSSEDRDVGTGQSTRWR